MRLLTRSSARTFAVAWWLLACCSCAALIGLEDPIEGDPTGGASGAAGTGSGSAGAGGGLAGTAGVAGKSGGSGAGAGGGGAPQGGAAGVGGGGAPAGAAGIAGAAGKGGVAGAAGKGGVAGAAGNGGIAGAAGNGGNGGAAGAGGTAASRCPGLPATCGANGDDDCCSTGVTLPGGEVFHRVCDAAGTDIDGVACALAYPATVSSFKLDKYEVTVGRMRAFFSAYDAWRANGHPMPGEGGDPHVPGTAWRAEWSAELPSNAKSWTFALGVCGGTTWPAAPTATSEALPINCVAWVEAVAFCTWDGGWLPTDAEWAYAASGGEDRAFPWSKPPSSLLVSNTLANFDAPAGKPERVGSHPLGAGKWGHEDLGGNVFEWVFDGDATTPAGVSSTTCKDCVFPPTTTARRTRGGSYETDARALRSSFWGNLDATAHASATGFRCARKP